MADLRSRFGARFRLAALALGGIVLGGCASTFPPTGMILSQYSSEHVVPYVLKDTDVNMATCGTGLGQTHLVGSFSRVIWDQHYLLSQQEQMAGFCSEVEAFEANLDYLRARQNGRIAEAQDASIEQKNWHALTARRRYESYQHMVAKYGDPGGGECPLFLWSEDELVYMLGLIAGMQAVRDDMLSGGQVGVPKNLAADAAQGSECLDNEKWWGVPQAIRATTWAYVPGALPEGEDIWQTFRQAAEVAESSGVRLVHALYATAADNRGETVELKNAIREAVELGKEKPAPEQYTLADRIAMQTVSFFSDKLWTEEAGHRTPIGELGQFPGQSDTTTVNTEGLL